MEIKKTYCDGCSRGCGIVITAKGGKYYLSGNNCPTGEKTAREAWPFLKDTEIYKSDEKQKEGLLKKLFGRG